MIRWLGVKTVRFQSLRLSGKFKKRLSEPHVIALAASVNETGKEPINLPVVWWLDTETKKKLYDLTAGEDRVAALVLNGLEGKKSLEVRAFEGTADDARRVRAHENAHRRHDDRDAWLRSLTEGAWKSEESPPGSSGGTSASEEKPTSAGGASAGSDANGLNAEIVHRANADGYPLCGAELNGGDSTVGELVDAAVTCASCIALEAPPLFVDKSDKRNKLLRSEPAKSAQTAKSEARKKVAETVGTTPAAVKQAEYRDRKAKGEVKARKVHDDGAPAMSEAAQKLVADIAAIALALQHQQAAVTRMTERNPTLQNRFLVFGLAEKLKEAAAELRAMSPAAPCCYCIDAPTEDCHGCKGDRWLTKSQLRDAPEEMRKRVAS